MARSERKDSEIRQSTTMRENMSMMNRGVHPAGAGLDMGQIGHPSRLGTSALKRCSTRSAGRC